MVCEYEQAVHKSGNQNVSMLNRYLEKAQFTGMREMKMKTIMRKQCPLYTQKIGKIGTLGDTKGWRGHG